MLYSERLISLAGREVGRGGGERGEGAAHGEARGVGSGEKSELMSPGPDSCSAAWMCTGGP